MSRKIPRALEPAGIVLLDKPAGISSFAAIAELRRRTGARTGHAGTLDPFATGLLVVLSGSATRLAQSFVKLDKRYVTEIDLTATTSTGDPEGEVVETHDAPTPDELEVRLEALRGEIELPIPAASAVKIDGERAYRLHRRGVAVEMPLRRSRVRCARRRRHDRSDGHARPARQLRNLRPRDRRGTRRSLPNSAPNRGRPVLRRGGRPSRDSDRRGAGEARVKIATAPEELGPGRRAVAIGTFDGVHLGHRRVLETVRGAGLTSTVVTFDPHPRTALGNRVELLTTRERRLELLAEAGVDEALVLTFDLDFARTTPEEFAERYLRGIGAEVVAAGSGFRFGHRREGDLALLESLGFDVRAVPVVEGISSSAIRALVKAGEVDRAAPMLGRPVEVEGVVVSGDARGGTLGFPTANLRVEGDLLVPAYGIYAGAALETRAAISIGVNPHYGGVEQRVEAFLLDYDGDLYGRRLVVELWRRLRDERSFESEADLVAQIARDVEETRAAERPFYAAKP